MNLQDAPIDVREFCELATRRLGVRDYSLEKTKSFVWIDFAIENEKKTILWNIEKGFGIFKTNDASYSDLPSEYIISPREALDKIIKLQKESEPGSKTKKSPPNIAG